MCCLLQACFRKRNFAACQSRIGGNACHKLNVLTLCPYQLITALSVCRSGMQQSCKPLPSLNCLRWYSLRHVQHLQNSNDDTTVNSLCNGCFDYQEICPYIKLSLFRGTTAVRMQCLVANGVVLTSTKSLHRVSLQREFTVLLMHATGHGKCCTTGNAGIWATTNTISLSKHAPASRLC